VPVLVDEATSDWLLANPGADVTIDLDSTTLTLPTGVRARFPLEPFARYCLMNGVDELGFLLSKTPEIDAYERRRTAL
jgi:3-isopropylmalate/(R)-2-methylmalate dehydratase small subunit